MANPKNAPLRNKSYSRLTGLPEFPVNQEKAGESHLPTVAISVRTASPLAIRVSAINRTGMYQAIIGIENFSNECATHKGYPEPYFA